MFGMLLIVVFIVIVLFAIGAYNRLVSLRNQTQNAWKQIDVQLKRRHDLIPNLINTVKGAMNFERGTLEAVVAARNTAIAASNSGSVPATAAAETQLTGALSRLLAVVEAYPDLKSTGNVAQLQEELTATENKIGFSRRCFSREWPAQRKCRCGRSPTKASAQFHRLTSRWDHRRRERNRQPVRTAASEQESHSPARRRIHPLRSVARIRRRLHLVSLVVATGVGTSQRRTRLLRRSCNSRTRHRDVADRRSHGVVGL